MNTDEHRYETVRQRARFVPTLLLLSVCSAFICGPLFYPQMNAYDANVPGAIR
jgi:hypothetical protein